MADDDRNRMRRQAILTRYATLDPLGLTTYCKRAGKSKVVFPTREAAEGARDEFEQVDPDQEHQQAYLCSCRSYYLARVRDERKAS